MTKEKQFKEGDRVYISFTGLDFGSVGKRHNLLPENLAHVSKKRSKFHRRK